MTTRSAALWEWAGIVATLALILALAWGGGDTLLRWAEDHTTRRCLVWEEVAR